MPLLRAGPLVACLAVALGSWAWSVAQVVPQAAALRSVVPLQLVPLPVADLSQGCVVQRLVAQGLSRPWGQEAGETVCSVGTTSGEQAGEECP